jgi:hypothetical protein
MTRMRIEIPAFGVVATARLDDEVSRRHRRPPDIAAVHGPGIHAMRAGREVFTLIPAPHDGPGRREPEHLPDPG